MSNFIKILKNYENICILGRKIVDHKDLVRRACPTKLDEEFKKQEMRIQEFSDLVKKAEIEWENHPCSINTYWTGLS